MGEFLALQRGQSSLFNEKVGQPQSLLGVAGGVAQVQQHLAALAGFESSGNLIHAGRSQQARLEIENGGVLVLLFAQRGKRGIAPSKRQLVGIGLARAHY